MTALPPSAGSGEPIVVRALESDAEVAAFFDLAAQTFPGYLLTHCAEIGPAGPGTAWRRFVEGLPGFQPDWLRGAFRGHVLLGGYQHHERWLGLGSVRIRTGYVGAVVTHPDHRGQGVASALMRDGVEHARARRQALVVLRGIPDFYHRFGYVDVMEVTEHLVDRAAVAALPPSECRTRPATLDDAPALLDLYERHNARYPGYCLRTLEHQEHLMRHRRADCAPIVAVDAAGQVRGYALVAASGDGSRAIEAAGDTGPSTLALLQHHARQLDSGADPSATLTWLLPPDSLTYEHLADLLPLQTRTSSRPRAGFMACPTHVPELGRSLVPLLRERWQPCAADRIRALRIDLGDDRCVLELGPSGAPLPNGPNQTPETIRLSPGVFTQLVFGFRSAAWAAAQPGQRVPAAVVPALAALVPSGPACYPESNRC